MKCVLFLTASSKNIIDDENRKANVRMVNTAMIRILENGNFNQLVRIILEETIKNIDFSNNENVMKE